MFGIARFLGIAFSKIGTRLARGLGFFKSKKILGLGGLGVLFSGDNSKKSKNIDYDRNTPNSKETTSPVKQKPEEPKLKYESKKFNYKKIKFSKDRIIDQAMNDYYKTSKLRSYKIQELEQRIIHILDTLFNKEKSSVNKESINDKIDYSNSNSNISLSKKRKSSNFLLGLGLLAGLVLLAKKIKNKTKQKLKSLKNYIKQKAKNFLKKHKTLRKIITNTKLAKRKITNFKNNIKQKAKNFLKKHKTLRKIITNTKLAKRKIKQISNKTKQTYNKVKQKVLDPFGIKTKITNFIEDKKSKITNFIEDQKTKIKDFIKEKSNNLFSKIKDTAKNLYKNPKESLKPKESLAKTENKLGGIGEDLEDFRKTEETAKTKLEQRVSKQKQEIDDLIKQEQELKKARKNSSFFNRSKLAIKETYLSAKRKSIELGNWIFNKASQTKELLKTATEKGKYYTKKLLDLKTKIPSKINDFWEKFRKVGKAGLSRLNPLLKRIPYIGTVLITALTILDLSKAKNNLEVRNILGSGIGGIVGGLIGSIGFVAGPIVGFLLSILMSFIGDWVGQQLSYFGVKPIDLIDFTDYNSPIKQKKLKLQEKLANTKIPSIFYNEEIFKQALEQGKHLESPEEHPAKQSIDNSNKIIEKDIQPEPEQSANSNKIIEKDIQPEPSPQIENTSTENTISDTNNKKAIEQVEQEKQKSSKNSTALIQVHRQFIAPNPKGKWGYGKWNNAFVGGVINVISGGKTLFSAVTIEQAKEGTQSGQNLRIPSGEYNLMWHFSGSGKKYLSDTPKLYNSQVSANRGILFHFGNTPAWSAGCVVFAYPGNPLKGVNSRDKSVHDKFRDVIKGIVGHQPKSNEKIPIKAQIFNDFSNDITGAKIAKSSEEEQTTRKITNNNKVNNRTLLIIKEKEDEQRS